MSSTGSLRIPRVDALDLASMLGRFWPEGTSIELVAEDRAQIRRQLADHMAAELSLTTETAERFYTIVTSPFYAERVSS